MSEVPPFASWRGLLRFLDAVTSEEMAEILMQVVADVKIADSVSARLARGSCSQPLPRSPSCSQCSEPSSTMSLGGTFWVPATSTPRCGLEALALSVFRFHTVGRSFDPARSGAEWWCQVRTHRTGKKAGAGEGEDLTREPKRRRIGDAAGGVTAEEESTSVEGSVGLHWDKDEHRRADTGEAIHPLLSTVTYLCSSGAPTLILDRYIDGTSSSSATISQGSSEACLPAKSEAPTTATATETETETEARIRNVYLSWPRVAKHIAFDGRLL